MSWRVHVIREGEYLELLAERFHFDAATVWRDARNAALRELRPDPNMLAPGDLFQFPEDEPVSARCVARRDNRYTGRLPLVRVSVVMQDCGEPLADEAYVIDGLAERIEGNTSAEGRIEFHVPIHVREVSIELPRLRRVHPVRIGHLDPIETDRGVRQRLSHLGYAGPRAIERFQRDNHLDPSGALDEATRARLREAHRA